MFISGPKNWIFTHYIYVVFIDKPHYIMKMNKLPLYYTAMSIIGTHNGRWILDKNDDLFIILVWTKLEGDLGRALIDYWP